MKDFESNKNKKEFGMGAYCSWLNQENFRNDKDLIVVDPKADWVYPIMRKKHKK